MTALFRRIAAAGLSAALTAVMAFPQSHAFQSHTMTQGQYRMELMLERLDGDAWHTIDPGLVLEQGDRVRFVFHTSFDGFLYVTNLNTSGGYEQLFPRAETGADNRIVAGQEYKVPATTTVFRIAGPPGFETVYWL